MIRDLRAINNLDMSEAMYMAKEYLLGIHTLSLKFSKQFEMFNVIFGINCIGKVKVWISEEFMKCCKKSKKISLNG